MPVNEQMSGCKGALVWMTAFIICTAIIHQTTAKPFKDDHNLGGEREIENDPNLNDLLREFYDTEHYPQDQAHVVSEHLSLEQIEDGIFPDGTSQAGSKEHSHEQIGPNSNPQPSMEEIGRGIYDQEPQLSIEHHLDSTNSPKLPMEQIGDGVLSETDSGVEYNNDVKPNELDLVPSPTIDRKSSHVDKEKTHFMEENNLFEGDLKIPQELIQAFYGTGSEVHDSAARKTHHWPGAIVYYEQDAGLDTDDQHIIRDAMDHWEDRTCLRFIKRDTETGYIYFQDTDSGCYSDNIGKNGSKQIINIEDPGCKTIGITIHEIGHAVGFWHEQSRPDRNSYITINEDNIEEGREDQFKIRTLSEVDSLGVVYDYGSIMHYRKTAFAKCFWGIFCPTIEVSNDDEYESQGSPKIGQRGGLSNLDVQQAKLLYDCTDTGTAGVLKIFVGSAHNLPDTDGWLNEPDPFVCLTAVDAKGHKETVITSIKRGTTGTTYNELLITSAREWSFFRIQILDDDGGWSDNDRMSVSETVIPKGGQQPYQKHCVNDACNGYVYFDYNFIVDGQECAPTPCYNGGTCIEQIASYKCSCTAGWGGVNCDIPNKTLKLYIRSASNLPDEDGLWNESDPYVEIVAVDSDGGSVRKLTSDKGGNLNPTWNEWVDFGTDTWQTFTVRVWDLDGFFNGADDPLSAGETCTVSAGAHTFITISTYGGGSLTFDYYFQ